MDQGKVGLWSGGQVNVKSQEFSELDIGGRETCKHNFENSDIFKRESLYIKIIEFYQELQNFVADYRCFEINSMRILLFLRRTSL